MLIDVTPYFENTTMQESYNSSNKLIGYCIYPCEGYVLHTSSYDEPVIDEETGKETGEIILGYIDSYVMLTRNYDFEANPLNIYAVLESEANERVTQKPIEEEPSEAEMEAHNDINKT